MKTLLNILKLKYKIVNKFVASCYDWNTNLHQDEGNKFSNTLKKILYNKVTEFGKKRPRH